MDRRVKERLIGASILVVLVVLVVPELLSGPKAPAPQLALPAAASPEPNRTVTVDLSTSKSAASSIVRGGLASGITAAGLLRALSPPFIRAFRSALNRIGPLRMGETSGVTLEGIRSATDTLSVDVITLQSHVR